MKKIFILIATLSLVIFFGCKKTSSQELVHSEVAGSQLQGIWQQVVSLQTEISTNQDNPTQPSGTVNSKSTTTLTLNPDQNFSIETITEFISYSPAEGTEEDPPLESLEEYFSQKISVSGKFVSTDSLIQYNHDSVIVNDGTAVTFEDFAISNPNAGTKIQTAGWRLDGDKLYLTPHDDAMQPELVYNRVQ